MSKFDSNPVIKMKLGEILKSFTNSNYAMAESAESSMSSAVPIWEVLGMTEKDYTIKYPPVDISGNDKSSQSVSLEVIDDELVEEEVDE